MVARHENILTFDFPGNAEPLEHEPDHIHVLRVGVLDANLAARHNCRADKTAHFKVIRADAELTSVQPVYALYCQAVGADAVYLSAKRDEKIAHILHVRLGRSVADRRRTPGKD